MAERTIIDEPQCLRCKHFIVWPYCDAFDGEIPSPIRRGLYDHRREFSGDNGIRFEALDVSQD